MQKIGLDIDDVLFPWSMHAHQAVRRAGKDNGAEVTQWECHKDYGITREEFWAIIEAEYLDGMLFKHPPYAFVTADILGLMRADFEVHLITARGHEGHMAEMVREETRRWLDFWRIPHDSLTFTRDKASLGMDYFLDDSIPNVTALRAAGCEAYLRDQQHNRSSDLPRVADLSDFVEKVLLETRVLVGDRA